MKEQPDILAELSHEFRSPLTSIMGFASLLLQNRDRHLDTAELEYAERIMQNSKYLFELVNSILEYARLEKSSFEKVHLETVDLGALLLKHVQMVEGQALDKGISLIKEIPEGLSPITSDKEKLSIIFSNLLSNAIKFTHEGKVTARIVAKGSTPMRVEIEDTGEGIDIEGMKGLFEPFSQSKKEHAKKGFGIGLAITKTLADLLRLRIEVKSTPGRGSLFSLYFPEMV